MVERLPVMSNIKVFVMKDGQPACRTKTTNYTDPYDTHMDHKLAL